MKWFVISPSGDDVEFECDDDGEGQTKVLAYLTDSDSTFVHDGYDIDEMIVIRGERWSIVPPKDTHQLIRIET